MTERRKVRYIPTDERVPHMTVPTAHLDALRDAARAAERFRKHLTSHTWETDGDWIGVDGHLNVGELNKALAHAKEIGAME